MVGGGGVWCGSGICGGGGGGEAQSRVEAGDDNGRRSWKGERTVDCELMVREWRLTVNHQTNVVRIVARRAQWQSSSACCR